MHWHLLVLSLPTGNATARMRAWRSLKACGAAVLRDGVYVLPDQEGLLPLLTAVATDVMAHQGSAHVLQVVHAADELLALFDRSADFAAWQQELLALQMALPVTHGQRLQAARKLRKRFEQMVQTDYFPGAAQQQALRALQALDALVARAASADEPVPGPQAGPLPSLHRDDHQSRRWATRRRPGVDRLACAWLIRRFIDEQAEFIWLARPADCPADALGYDFDGAAFSHQGMLVSFQVLVQCFGLESQALRRLGALVQALDVGGALPPEAAGVEAVLAGMRAALTDDEQLRLASAGVFEGLWLAFEQDAAKARP